jgi:hypothetical protein
MTSDVVRYTGRGWSYDVEWFDCIRCDGTGERVECIDDLCHAQGRCMHDPTNNTCNLCEGLGRITCELARRWRQRDSFDSVTLPDADLRARRKLHAVARERYRSMTTADGDSDE